MFILEQNLNYCNAICRKISSSTTSSYSHLAHPLQRLASLVPEDISKLSKFPSEQSELYVALDETLKFLTLLNKSGPLSLLRIVDFNKVVFGLCDAVNAVNAVLKPEEGKVKLDLPSIGPPASVFETTSCIIAIEIARAKVEVTRFYPNPSSIPDKVEASFIKKSFKNYEDFKQVSRLYKSWGKDDRSPEAEKRFNRLLTQLAGIAKEDEVDLFIPHLPNAKPSPCHRGEGRAQFFITENGQLLKNIFISSEESFRLKEREVLALSVLRKFDNVPRLVGYSLVNSTFSILTEMLSSDTLYDRIHCTNNEIQPADFTGTRFVKAKLNLLLGVANGLALLHEVGIMHRHLSSASIMFDDLGRPVINDFAAIKFDNNPVLSSNYKSSANLFYSRAPESAIGGKENRFLLASDVYSLGVIIWEVLTGRLPFGNEMDSTKLYSMIIDAKIEPDSLETFFLHNDEITGRVKLMLKKCWEYSPEKRPTAVEVLKWLEDLKLRLPS